VQEGTPRCLLAVLAHPDDETFGCGGTLARYAAEGARVALVCATRGEVGEISDPSLATKEDLARVREQELRAACDVLGVKELFLLGYRDSGMAGTQDNRHPQSLCQASRREVVGRIVRVIRQIKPQVVVTFDPNGVYGHPDHVAIHRATREAFSAADDSAQYVEQLKDGLEPYYPRKLYYIGFPRSMVRAFQEAMSAAGIQSDFNDLDPETLGVPDEDITTVMNVGPYMAQKEQAARCHRTQVPEDRFFSWMPETVRVRFLSTEYLIRAQPPSTQKQAIQEDDLFTDIWA